MKMQAFVPMVALRPFPYAKRALKVGDVFQASQRDARILIALRRAQADPAGSVSTAQNALETPPRDLVHEAMEIPQKRGPGRPRKAGAA